MDRLGLLLKSRRSLLGITQVELAHASGVSLPTIQNLEASKGNPGLSVLEPLLRALGLRLEPVFVGVDWDALVGLGVPLSGRGAHLKRRDGEALVSQLKLAALETRGFADAESARKREALGAVLLALKCHYPSLYKKRCFGAPVLDELLPEGEPVSGRLIKLRRQALAVLAEYL